MVTPGLEAVTAAELAALGLRSARTTTGGVRFTATSRQLYSANLWLRTANRIVVRIARFDARTFAALEAAVASLDWAAWVAPGQPVRLRVSSSGSRLHHTGAIAERVRRAGELDAGTDDEALLVVVRIVHDQVTISVDSSGAPLWKRGWRLESAKAPMRETLAAAIVLGARWDPASPLVDPLCGSGTIPIEAALLALGRAPGRDRTFAFTTWPAFEPGTWASVVEQARLAEAAGPAEATIVASDRDDGAVRATRANAARAGVSDALIVERRSISELRAPGTAPATLLTNPPYGKRVRSGADRRDLFARLGAVARRQLRGGRVALLVDDASPVGSTGLHFTEELRTSNGGIAVRLLVATT